MCVCGEQMSSFDVEQLRQALEEETESLSRGSVDEVRLDQPAALKAA